MIRYHVRSKSLVDVYNDIKEEKLILSPHFQRKLVWRETHKKDFIRTILEGYPFPEVFISRGKIDLESMSSVQCVVDGQQRLSTIREFVENKFDVDGLHFSDLDAEKKSEFLKYEIAVIDLETDEDDPAVKEIFKRLNRTFYALSQIERMSTEYGAQDLMLVAKLIAGEYYSENSISNIDPDLARNDPNLNRPFMEWAESVSCRDIQRYLLEHNIFSSYEISRQVHLNYSLNLICTMLLGYYPRNDGIRELLERNSDELDWTSFTTVVNALNDAAHWLLDGPLTHSFWQSKSNAYTLIIEAADLCYRDIQTANDATAKLAAFAADPDPDYRLAAKEGVNNLKERSLRGRFTRELLSPDAVGPEHRI